MRGVNKFIGIGTLGGDPEIRYTGSGSAVANFSIAINETWKDKQGEKQERTEWVNITIFGKLAEIAGEYAVKGSKVYVEGSLRTEKYTDKNGVDRYSTKVYVDTMQLLGDSRKNDGESKPRREERGASHQKQAALGLEDDDIPF